MKKKTIPNKQTKTIKKRKKRRSPVVILLSLICIGLALFLCTQIIKLNILPLTLVIPIAIIIVVIAILLFLFYCFISRRPITRWLSGIFILAFTIVYGLGNYYIYKVNGMFTNVTNLTDQITNTISVVTLNGSGYGDLKSLNNKTIGTILEQDDEGTKKAEADISKSISYSTIDYTTFGELYDALYNDEVQAIILNETFRGVVFEMDENANNMTGVVNQTVYYTERDHKLNSSQDAVKNITSETFTVLISGNDSYGGLTTNSRSDSNMLVTVNPNTKTVLMTSVPRDYYEPIQCGDEDTGLACPQGEYDKLTHTGLYGIDSTERTIENFLNTTINYNVRVNFSSLTNLVDALGGIDVFVEDGLAVERFNADWSLAGVEEGWNHLEGKRALAFARERYAYQDGDNQRVKNQQIVIQAMVDKLTSSAMISRFGDFMDALSGAFETNMASEEILSLLRYEFTFMPDWTFESYAMFGDPSSEFCATLGGYADVFIPNEQSIQIAHDKIQAVIDGKSSTTVSEEIEVVVPDYSQEIPYDSSYYVEPDYSYEEVYYE